MDKKTEIEAATFRRIVKHLQDNPEVQNIDLMNLANFCRNCISKWYVSESTNHGEEISYDQARELVYGMPYDCLLYTSPSPRDLARSRMPSSA